MSPMQGKRRPQVSIWDDARVRSRAIQALVLLLAGLFFYDFVVGNAGSLASRNIASGWDFLSRSAGFDVVFSLIAYSSESSYGRVLLVGLLNTLMVSALGIVLATLLGLPIGVMRLSRNWLAARVAAIYVEFIRNTPLLLQIFIWYALVLRPLPDARDAIRFWDIGALSNKGLTLPRPCSGPWRGSACSGL